MIRFGAARALLFAATLLGAASARADSPVYVVMFTHVEDQTPGGPLGSTQSRQNYQTFRSKLIAMAALAESSDVQWTLQPDWKLLEAALLYEDAALQATTNGKNFLRYLKEDRGVVIDPHSHERLGYNYTDVAHLLDSLGVGATTVIGGHVWDPLLPQFQEWDRYRVPVAGEHYPGAIWRGDILIGSGTPDHVNDPLISGVWRPRDRDHYFEHDPTGNIAAIGQYKKSIESIGELIALYRFGAVPPTAMLTFSCNINPATLSAPNGLAAVLDTVIVPLAAWRDSGLVLTTDFTSLIHTWETTFGAVSYVYDAEAPVVGVDNAARATPLSLAPVVPNPIATAATVRFTLEREANVRVDVFDVHGRAVARLASGRHAAGSHVARWDPSGVPAGVYLCRLEEVPAGRFAADRPCIQRIVVVR